MEEVTKHFFISFFSHRGRLKTIRIGKTAESQLARTRLKRNNFKQNKIGVCVYFNFLYFNDIY